MHPVPIAIGSYRNPAKDIIVLVETICLEPAITVFVKVRTVRFYDKTLQVIRKYYDNPFADRNELSIGWVMVKLSLED